MTASAPSSARIGWIAAFHPRYWGEPTVLALIAANLLPLAAAPYFGWDLFDLIVLYWMETGVIGAYAILQIAIVAPASAIFLVPFFVVHFGGFMVGHIFFLAVVFAHGWSDRLEDLPGPLLTLASERGLWLALAALVISHGVSFVRNIPRPDRYDRRDRQPRATAELRAAAENPQSLMFAPYRRIVIMHVTIFIGAFVAQSFGTQAAAIVVLAVLKIAVDVAAHVRKNFRPGAAAR